MYATGEKLAEVYLEFNNVCMTPIKNTRKPSLKWRNQHNYRLKYAKVEKKFTLLLTQ